LDYIREEEGEVQNKMFDQNDASREKRRNARREKRRKMEKHKLESQHAELTSSNIARHDKLKGRNEKSSNKRKVGRVRWNGKCKRGRRGRFSPSTLSTIHTAPPGGQLTIGQLSIRQGKKDWGDGYMVEDTKSKKVTFCPQHPVQNRQPCHQLTLENGEWVIHRQRQLPFWDHARGALVTYHSSLYLLGGKSWVGVESGWASTEVLERSNVAWQEDRSSLGSEFGQLENFCTSWVSHSRLAVVGGRGPGGLRSQTRIYNFQVQEWQELTHLPEGRTGLACFATENMLLVAGGFSSSSECARCVCQPSESSRQTWLLPLSAQSEAKWRRLPDLVRARNNFHLAQLGSRLLAVGSGAGVVEEWKEGKWVKVEGLSLPWDIKVTPLSVSTAKMEVSKDADNDDNTEIGLKVAKTKIPETNMQASSVATVSRTVMETTEDISESTVTMHVRLDIKLEEAEKITPGGLELTSKTFMEITEEIDVDNRAEEETTQDRFSSLANVGSGGRD